jgi:hypothetical protein
VIYTRKRQGQIVRLREMSTLQTTLPDVRTSRITSVSKHASQEARLGFVRIAIVIHCPGPAGTVRLHLHDLATGESESIEEPFDGPHGRDGLGNVAREMTMAAIGRAVSTIFAR